MSKLAVDEIEELQEKPLVGVCINAIRRSTSKWRITVDGPNSTLYRGHKFTLNLDFPKNYPNEMPTLKFASEFIHPDVSADGHVAFVYRAPNEVNIRQTLIKVLSLFKLRNHEITLKEQVEKNIENADEYQRYLRRYDELYELCEQPVKGIHIITTGNNSLKIWKFIMFGHPTSKLYARSYFSGLVEFPSKYPDQPPKVYFQEPFYHPCIDAKPITINKTRYSVCLPIFQQWTSNVKMRRIFECVVALMDVSVDDIGRRIIGKLVARSRGFAMEDNFPIPENIDEYEMLSLVRVPFPESEEH